jgi:predicted ATPase
MDHPTSARRLASTTRRLLRSERERADPLAIVIHEKTTGNPFFAIQFISRQHPEDLVPMYGMPLSFDQK